MSAFLKPSEAEGAAEAALLARGESFDHMGRRRIIHPDSVGEEVPKLVGYTRATTYIKAIDDTAGLEKWRTRLTLEGATEAKLESEVGAAMHSLIDAEWAASTELERIVAAGEKLTKTARNELTERPGKDYRKRLDEIAEYAFFLAGGREAAEYGTAHHELVDRWFKDTLTPEFQIETEDRWPGILRDFAAFQDSWRRFAGQYGANVEESEAMVVDDRLQVAGRTDYIVRVKLPGDERSRRVIMDLKSGKIDGELRFSQQLALYAGSKRYDPSSGERTNLRVRQDIGIIIHAPRGEGVCTFHVIQLAPGRTANALCAKVRASRRKIPGLRTVLELEEVTP